MMRLFPIELMDQDTALRASGSGSEFPTRSPRWLQAPRRYLAAFERLLCLNPRDEQGARLNWTAIQDGRLWEDEAEVEHALN